MEAEDLVGHYYKDIKKYYPSVNIFVESKDGIPKEDTSTHPPDFVVEVIDNIIVTARKYT